MCHEGLLEPYSNPDTFDFEQFKEQAHQQLKDGASLLGTDTDGVLTPLIKQFLEESLEAELDVHLDEQATPGTRNRRNGKARKRVRASVGPVEVTTPRDRDSSFQPKILPKRERQLSPDLDRQIIALYARGSSYGDIRDFRAEMYDLEVSTATISRITDKILPLVHEWRSRPLEAIYPFVWLDAIHYKVRHEGRVVTRAIYSRRYPSNLLHHWAEPGGLQGTAGALCGRAGRS